MKRTSYFNYIEEKLNLLSLRIKTRGKINLLDLHIHSETFFAELFNVLFDYDLTNLNAISQNVEAIDLIDETNKIIIQVSATATKDKIKTTLDKEIFKNYNGFSFKFIAISGDVDNKLKSQIFNKPVGISFNPLTDIYDVSELLRKILFLNIGKQREIYGFIKEELGSETDIIKVNTNLASIIKILSKENLAFVTPTKEINPFEVQRKIEFNDLLEMQYIIDDHKVYYSHVDRIYREFDKNAVNKSLSIFSLLNQEYIKLAKELSDSTQVFFSIVENMIELTQVSKNYEEIPYEELELCVSIIVVDSFIRCKIFKNPEGYKHVAS